MTKSKAPLGAQMSLALKARGVDVIFGIPGVHNVELYRGIEQAGIRHVLARHEQGAGFMADGYARATGRPGVAYVITGPGLCNIMTPMGQAYSDSVPILVVSSCLDDTVSLRGQLHQMKDQVGAAATVCDWSIEAGTADNAYHLIDRALAEFSGQRARPKHIQVPIAVLGAQADPAPVPIKSAHPPVAASGAVSEVAQALIRAEHPVVILGGGVARVEGITGLATALLDRSGAAFFPTYAGRGLVASDHPMNFGSVLPHEGTKDILARADLVLAVGTELAEVDLWRDDLGHRAPMVRVDIDPEMLNDRHQADIRVLGEGGAFLRDLVALLPDVGQAPGWDAKEIARLRAGFRAATDAARPGIVPILDAVRAALPTDTVIYSDMTQFAYAGKEVWPLDQPNRWHHPTGFGTLGYALPAAIGGKIGLGEDPVVAFIGDYGFHYTMAELGVAVELNLSLPIILWDNGKLKEIEDSMVASQIAPNAVVAQNPDFCRLAEAFGARSAEPHSLDALAQAVQDALNAPGPTLIHVTPDIL